MRLSSLDLRFGAFRSATYESGKIVRVVTGNLRQPIQSPLPGLPRAYGRVAPADGRAPPATQSRVLRENDKIWPPSSMAQGMSPVPLALLFAAITMAQIKNPPTTVADVTAAACIFRSHHADCHGLTADWGKD